MTGRGIDVRVGREDDELTSAKVLTIGPDSVRVRLPADAPPLLAGAVARVAVRDLETRSGLVVAALVAPVPGESADVHELFFMDGNPFRDASIADRRRRTRIEPGPRSAIEAWLETGEGAPVEVALVDVGVGGLCLDRPTRLAEQGRCAVQLLLPDEVWPLAFALRLRHWRPVGAGVVRCGYAFDLEHTKEARAQALVLEGWIADLGARLAGVIRAARVGLA